MANSTASVLRTIAHVNKRLPPMTDTTSVPYKLAITSYHKLMHTVRSREPDFRRVLAHTDVHRNCLAWMQHDTVQRIQKQDLDEEEELDGSPLETVDETGASTTQDTAELERRLQRLHLKREGPRQQQQQQRDPPMVTRQARRGRGRSPVVRARIIGPAAVLSRRMQSVNSSSSSGRKKSVPTVETEEDVSANCVPAVGNAVNNVWESGRKGINRVIAVAPRHSGRTTMGCVSSNRAVWVGAAG